MPIRQLSPSVVNKIAAGEVIERPASVVKELVENALDAGATRIDVVVEQGGAELIRVVDNGGGIPADELLLAVASHATSKLVSADDLFQVRTLGFRGEALASIAEVSRFLLRSRPAAAAAGAQLEVNAGQVSPVQPAASAPGTTIEVRDLFCNTPVRRKFLRATQTEMGHISEAITRMALAWPGVHFTLRHNNREVYDLPPGNDLRERIALFFGRELAEDLLPVESRDEQVTLRGFIARPTQSRAHARMQYLFLNGRHIRDRSLGHALAEAYRGLLLTGRYGITFLCIDMPPELVDVNVHPTKLEVRFQDGGRLYSQLLGTLRTKFLTTDLTHRLSPARAGGADESLPASGAAGTAGPAPVDGPETAYDPARAERLRGELVAWARRETTAWERDDAAETASGTGDSATAVALHQPEFPFETANARRAPLETVLLAEPVGELRPANTKGAATSNLSASTGGRPALVAAEPSAAGVSARALQIHNRYLIAESDEGVLVIDQHALHERILYEQFREKVLAGALETQQLLVPEPVDLSAAEAAAVLEHHEVLRKVGITVEPFGGDTVLVSSVPAMLRRARPDDLLRSLADQLVQGGRAPERRDTVDELLHMMSCKAAVKAGDPLTPDEISALLEQRHLAQDTHHCPHGRPTALMFTREELDRQFKRT